MMRNLPAALQTFSELSSYSILTSKLVLSSHPPLQRVIVSLYNDLLQLDTQVDASNIFVFFVDHDFQVIDWQNDKVKIILRRVHP